MKKLTINDYNKIKSYLDLANYEGYNSNFVTMMMWDHEYHIEYEIHPNFLIMLQNYKGKQFFSMPFCKKEYLKDAIDYMIEYAKIHHFDFAIDCAITEFVEEIKQIYGNFFIYQRTPDNDDYIYSREALETLSGKKMQKRRNHYNAFIKENQNFLYKEIEDQDIDQVLACTRSWDNEHHNEESVQSEYMGIIYLLTHHKELNIKGGCIYIDGVLQAFIIGSLLKHNTIQIHIEKANKNIRGLYVAICKFFLEQNYPGYTLVNREEDMGLDYLRKTKRALHPVKMIEKYYIEISDIKIKHAFDKDTDAIKNLWLTCFKDETLQSTEFYFSTIYHPLHTYVLKHKDQLITMIQFNPYIIMENNKEVPAYFILGVATDPNYQKQGFMKKLLNHCLNLPEYKDKKILLQAYHWDLYRPFGFKQSHFHQRANLDLSYYKIKEPLQQVHDMSLLYSFYQSYVLQFDKFRVRSKAYYHDYFIPRCQAFEDHIMIFTNGYFVYHIENEIAYVSEFIYQDNNDVDDMIASFIKNIQANEVIIETDLKIHLVGEKEIIPVMMEKDIDKEEVNENFYINEIY